MQKLLVTAALIAALPFGAAVAQNAQTTTTITTTEVPAASAPVVNPEASANAAPSVQAPAESASLGSQGVVHEWKKQEPVAQTVPPAATEYPPCTRGRTDSCYNPDPRREADVRKDGKIGA